MGERGAWGILGVMVSLLAQRPSPAGTSSGGILPGAITALIARSGPKHEEIKLFTEKA